MNICINMKSRAKSALSSTFGLTWHECEFGEDIAVVEDASNEDHFKRSRNSQEIGDAVHEHAGLRSYQTNSSNEFTNLVIQSKVPK